MVLQLTETPFDSRMDILYDNVVELMGKEVADRLWATEFLNSMSDLAYESGIMEDAELTVHIETCNIGRVST